VVPVRPWSTLCRRRHNVDYADLCVMPTLGRNPLAGRVIGLKRSA